MKKWILPVVIILALVTTMVVPETSNAGPTLQQIEKQLADLKKNQAASEQRARDAKNKINQLQSEKSQVEKDIRALLTEIDETNSKLTELDQEIESVTSDLMENIRLLGEAEDRIESRDKLLKSRLRLVYTSGFVSYLDVLMSATSFGDFLNRLNALQSLVSQDKEILESNIRDRAMIAEKKSQIEIQLAQVELLYEETEMYKQDLLEQEREKEVRIASLEKEEENLHGITDEEEANLTAIAKKSADLTAQKRELEKQAQMVYSGGKLAYPLPKSYRMTSDFGTRTDPITGKKGAFHQGVDYGAPRGTDILAAEKGVVIVAESVSGYGNTVIIDHGSGLWTVYAHMQPNGIKVKREQVVERGQKIGEVGMTGRSTGYHLHFEVRLNGKQVDPKPYLK